VALFSAVAGSYYNANDNKEYMHLVLAHLTALCGSQQRALQVCERVVLFWAVRLKHFQAVRRLLTILFLTTEPSNVVHDTYCSSEFQ
jgi:hypothetical protein